MDQSGNYSTPCFFHINIREGSTLGPNPSFKSGSKPNFPHSFHGSPSNPAFQNLSPDIITNIGSETTDLDARSRNMGSRTRFYLSRNRRCIMRFRTLWLNSLRGELPCIGSLFISSNRPDSFKSDGDHQRLNM